ncbi:MAG: transaldolase [Nitriliruptoraceae bacterium]
MTAATQALSAQGVALWLDDLSRARLDTGNLADLIETRDVVGVTTNPSIFQAAITSSDDYAADVARLKSEGADAEAIVRALTTDDVRRACDLLRPIWEATDGQDGRVSIEVDPRLAHDTDATIAQAAELWAQVDRENLLVKIPGTAAGLPAIRAAIAAGISVNVTLLFAVERYREVLDAYHAGLEDRLAAGEPIDRIRSVASFFVSRVDTAVDPLLAALGTEEAAALQGTAAVANARLAYGAFLEVADSDRWQALEEAGAHPQRPLWASTGVKNPAYRPTLYIDQLVAPGTVNTMPEATLEAVAAAEPVSQDTITPHLDDARTCIDQLSALGIDLEEVTTQLETDGVARFERSWTELLAAVDEAG